MNKPPKKGPGPEFSREREWGVILEDLQSQFKVFGEGLGRVEQKLEKLDSVESDLAQVKEDVAVLKSAFRPFTLQVSDHEHRINDHERRLTAVEKPR